MRFGSVSDLNEAVRLARTGNCRGAILDFQLGSSNTVQIARELESLQTQFVVYTGYHCADQMPSHRWGCRLVSKPANIARLVRTLAALMRCERLFSHKTGLDSHPIADPSRGPWWQSYSEGRAPQPTPLADTAIQYARLFGPLRTKFKRMRGASLFLAIPRFDPEHVDLRLRSGR